MPPSHNAKAQCAVARQNNSLNAAAALTMAALVPGFVNEKCACAVECCRVHNGSANHLSACVGLCMKVYAVQVSMRQAPIMLSVLKQQSAMLVTCLPA